MRSPREIRVHTSLDMSSDDTTEKYEALYIDTGAVQVTWTGNDAANGSVKVQASVEPLGNNFVDLPKGEIIMETAGGSKLIQLTDLSYRWVRFKYTAGDNTTGTLNTYAIIKSLQ